MNSLTVKALTRTASPLWVICAISFLPAAAEEGKFDPFELKPEHFDKIDAKSGDRFDHGADTYFLTNGPKEKGLMIKSGEKYLKHGVHYRFDDDGNLKEKTTYKLGLKDGAHIVYNKDGSIYEQYAYKDDKEHGPYIRYHPNGTMVVEREYAHGKRHGLQTTYHKGKNDEQGGKNEETMYVEGDRHGDWKFFDEKGVQKAEGRYEKDKRVHYKWFH